MVTGVLFSKTIWLAKVPLDQGTACHWRWWGSLNIEEEEKKKVKLLETRQKFDISFFLFWGGSLLFLGL